MSPDFKSYFPYPRGLPPLVSKALLTKIWILIVFLSPVGNTGKAQGFINFSIISLFDHSNVVILCFVSGSIFCIERRQIYILITL